ncbi:MAG: acylphosphatase [Bacillota bacterium]|nr:acylphosphatase [Bacillota bacterium]
MKRYHIIVSGQVQQVGFRFFSYKEALSMKLTGWVKNCYDGRVEIEVQGEEHKLDIFLYKIREGNLFSDVENVSIDEAEIKGEEKSFRIVY